MKNKAKNMYSLDYQFVPSFAKNSIYKNTFAKSIHGLIFSEWGETEWLLIGFRPR